MYNLRALLLLVLWGISLNTSAQLFTENFGTTFSTTYLGAPNWSTCRSTSSNTATGACSAVGDYSVNLSNNQYLITNQITLPASGYCLNFSYVFNSSSNFPRVQVGTGGALCSSGTIVWTDLGILPQSATCAAASYSLSPYAGQTVWIRFLAGASFSSWYIDDISINNTSCSAAGCNATVFSDPFADGTVGSPEWVTVSAAFTSTGTPCNGGNSRAYFSTVTSPAEIISRDIDLTTATYAQFSMNYTMVAAASTIHCAFVEVSANGGSTWADINPPYTDPDGNCQTVTANLSAYLGDVIRIRIRRRTTTYTFYFDNVEVCTGGAGVARVRWADNFNDNDLLLDYPGNPSNETCPSCGPWVMGAGASLNLVPSGGWNGNTNETEAFPDNMPNVYYVRLDRNEYIESPVIDLSNSESLKISFYAKSSSPGTGGGDQWDFSDRLRLQLWNGTSWVTVQSLRDDLTGTWNGTDDFISAALPFNYYCFTAYKSGSSPGNYYYASSPNVSSTYFHSGFKFRVIFEGGFSGAPFAWVDDFTFRADADGYSTMIPCGISFWNEPSATAYGRDIGTSGNNNAEKGVELELGGSINIPPTWATQANDGDQVSQAFGVNEAERVVFCVLSEQEIGAAFPVVHFYAPSMGWQSSIMSIDNTYTGPGWKYYAVEYISCDLAGGSIAEPTDQFRYYFTFEYGIEFMPVFYHLNTSGIEYGGGVTSSVETFDAPDVVSNNGCGLLSVVWADVGAHWVGEDAKVHWRTEVETGSLGFVVERSMDGEIFETIGEVEALGAGYPYTYKDAGAAGLDRVLYYRVRQVDAEGANASSEVVRLVPPDGMGIPDFTLAENPSAVLRLRLEVPLETKATGRVLNMSGQVVAEFELEAGSQAGDLLLIGLSSGVYVVEVCTGGACARERWLNAR